MRANDIQLQQVVIEYKTRLGGEGSIKRIPRSMMLTYMELVVASSAVITEEIGKMMYFRQYSFFAETYDGGKLTGVQARHQWAVWETQIQEVGSTWPPNDQKGPDGEKRIWVKTDDIMKFQSKLERQKQIQAKEKDIKNASEADLQRLHKQVQLDHEFACGRNIGSLRDQAVGLMQGGGSDAFSTRGMDIPNIDLLGTKEDEQEDGGDVASGDDQDGAETTVEGPATKKARWFNYDKVVPRALRNHKTAMDTFKEQLEWTKTQAEEALSLAKGGSATCVERDP